MRCVAAYLLHEGLLEILENHIDNASQGVALSLLDSLNDSRNLADEAVKDSDVATAFQESIVSDWGDGVAAVEQAFASAKRLSHVQGSPMFFLAQEASATRAILRMLSLLHSGKYSKSWDGKGFAEQPLIEMISQSMQKFLDSEERDGHLIDPNVWRNASESGGKVALYCTSFAAAVVDILKYIESLRFDQFQKHKKVFFPLLCNLVRVQSEEIRHFVQLILAKHVGHAIGVDFVEPR